MPRALIAAAALVLATAGSARGDGATALTAAAADAAAHVDDGADLDVTAEIRVTREPDAHTVTAALEEAIVFAIPTAYYWKTQKHQSVDWELDGSWASWKVKLFSTEKLKFDTNPFHVNAIRHPVAGVIDYQIARTNGFGWIAATGFTYVKSALWEYLVEY